MLGPVASRRVFVHQTVPVVAAARSRGDAGPADRAIGIRRSGYENDTASYDAALAATGVGAFQKRLFALFGLVWAADAMQVLAIGFTTPSIAAGFGIPVQQALQTEPPSFSACWSAPSVRPPRRPFRAPPVLIAPVLIDAAFGLASAFAPSFGWLLALRFLTGLGVGGTRCRWTTR